MVTPVGTDRTGTPRLVPNRMAPAGGRGVEAEAGMGAGTRTGAGMGKGMRPGRDGETVPHSMTPAAPQLHPLPEVPA